jgi:N-acetylmuramoyl-L-alanine amidase
MMKRSLLFAFFLSLTPVFFSFIPTKPEKQKVLKTIIIDAGHGIMANGGHNGAKGSYSYEDDICLAVAKELVIQLHEALPDVNIIETRPTTDITSLYRRADIANENKGDLFISIHCNAAPAIKHREFAGYKNVKVMVGKGKKKRAVTKKQAQYNVYTTPNPASGTETYIWGAHKNEDKEVAVRENAPMLQEDNYKEKYGDIDPNSPEFIALSLLKTKQFFKRSASLAGFVEDEFAKAGRASRGQHQRQIGIWVLQATAMPSVLVETGYITNKAEEDYLNSKSGQEEIARCVTDAVNVYVNWLEKSQQPVNDGTSKNNRLPDNNETKAFLDLVEQKEKKAF